MLELYMAPLRRKASAHHSVCLTRIIWGTSCCIGRSRSRTLGFPDLTIQLRCCQKWQAMYLRAVSATFQFVRTMVPGMEGHGSYLFIYNKVEFLVFTVKLKATERRHTPIPAGCCRTRQIESPYLGELHPPCHVNNRPIQPASRGDSYITFCEGNLLKFIILWRATFSRVKQGSGNTGPDYFVGGSKSFGKLQNFAIHFDTPAK